MTRLPDFASKRSAPAPPDERGRLLLGLAALAALVALLGALWARADLGQARATLAQARDAATARERRAAAEVRGDPAAALWQAQARLSAAQPPPRVLADLEALLPKGVRFERLSLRYGEVLELELAVLAREAGDYDRFLAALERSPLFADVTPGEENRQGEVRSLLRARYLGRGAR